ncbi:MAG TPA: alpha/beta fold hydrolase [Spongiibacteraceae bacterium]|jgi:pimeloyl-ACP methyl ester carboxylesterase
MSAIVVKQSFDIGELLTSEGSLSIEVEITLPTAAPREVPVVLFCLPGGAMDKSYFNLRTPEGDQFSFAQQMARHGCITIALDHLGTGGSGKPRDGFALTPDVVAEGNQRAVQIIMQLLRQGELHSTLPALPHMRTIGVGHSMGGMLTIIQQARFHPYSAIAVMGFSARGLPMYLDADLQMYVDNPQALRNDIEHLARQRGSDPYSELPRRGQSSEIYGGGVESAIKHALVAARTNIVATVVLMPLIPGSSAPECAQIDVPVFLVVGDRDMTGPPHEIPALFTGSRDITLQILPETGHTHFASPAHKLLFDRFAHWLREIEPSRE